MKKAKELKLALGEGSHTHVMTSSKDISYEINNEDIKFVLEGTGVVTHEEHDRIVLQPGTYLKYPQMEYDPFANEIRRVFD